VVNAAEVYDEDRQLAVKVKHLATLDSKLAENPMYLINLLNGEEEVARLSNRMSELKKTSLTHRQELARITTKLQESEKEFQKEQTTASFSGHTNKDILHTIDQLQRWISEKELTRVKSLEELRSAELKVAAMDLEAQLHKQQLADLEAAFMKKTREFKNYEFSLVKTAANAKQVEYDMQMMEFEMNAIKKERDELMVTVALDLKGIESFRSFCVVLSNRIQDNSPEIQLAEMQFGLQALHAGVSRLFSKGSHMDRLTAEENEANLIKAQRRISRKKSSAHSPGAHIPDSPINSNVSFRRFHLEGFSRQHPCIEDEKQKLPHYTSFQQVGEIVTSEVKVIRKSKVKNLSPPQNHLGHAWKAKYCSTPTWCHICKQFIKGLSINQQHAFKCTNCNIIGHRDCCHEFCCQCRTVVVDNKKNILVPADNNDHLWEERGANLEDTCELCHTYVSDKLPEKLPFSCRRCKVFGHRDCCAIYSNNRCAHNNDERKKRMNSAKLVGSMVMALSVSALKTNTHKFKKKYLGKPTWCCYCKQFIVGVTPKQQDAVKCSKCKSICHRHCAIKFNEGDEAKRWVCQGKKDEH
jgi:hypothetical protein